MKKNVLLFLLLICGLSFSQDKVKDKVYKKRVLESIEIDFLTSYYNQEGNNASVTGGIGNEDLQDFSPTIVVSIPLSDDDVISLDLGISTYTSASSSNGNPFDAGTNSDKTSSPWYASSGASKVDTWKNLNVDYSNSSDDRNTIITANISSATEWDYESLGFGAGITKLFNNKNTSVSLSTKIYLDKWIPIYPKELDAYLDAEGNTNSGYFANKTIFNQQGLSTNKWSPLKGFGLINDKSRNTYSISFLFSQILTKNTQFAFFIDLIKQQGWLANPLQRVYFSDLDNFYIGNPSSISIYTSKLNKDVFHLADDIERLPSTRIKIPIGMRFNYFLNENLTLRSYYRYYYDDWGINSHTLNLELPVKLSDKFTFYPSYRFYSQSKSDYFEPYDKLLSSSKYYTSDYDLSTFNSNQLGFGLKYVDIFTKFKIWDVGLKSIDLNYSNYKRNSDFKSSIVSMAVKFIID
tara:strand:+ start:2412 stop:3803 length:1392 start_codon:yes stop_codon:yes gene_type:complete